MGLSIRYRALLALPLPFVSACSGAGPLVPTDAVERASQELDILEAVFRYQFDHNASSATALGTADFYFLSLEEHRDPPPELLTRFNGHSPPVEPVSSADPDASFGVKHKQKGGQGIILRLESVRWIDDNTVEVDGGYYEASRSASGNTYRAERRDGGWIVVSDAMHWIS